MRPVTETEIRESFVNATQGEAGRAAMPDLDGVDFARLEYLGWDDPRRGRQSYVALELDGELVTLLLRRTEAPPRRRMLCAWCQDVIAGVEAMSVVAPRAGAAGRQGNSLGTAVCSDFGCSAHVRRPFADFEVRRDDPALVAFQREQRITTLRERVESFARAVLGDSD